MDTDIFLTLAEIAVAFAGFASVASAIGRRESLVDPRVNAVRLHNMVEISLMVIAFSLAPILFQRIVADARPLWMLSSAFAVVVGVAAVVRLTLRIRPIEALPGYDNAGANRVRLVAGSALIAMLIGTTGLLSRHAETLYLGAAFMTLVMSGMLFMRVIESLIYPPKTSEAAPGMEE